MRELFETLEAADKVAYIFYVNDYCIILSFITWNNVYISAAEVLKNCVIISKCISFTRCL